MIDKYLLDDLSRMSDEKGHLARWVIQLQIDLDVERRKAATLSISRDDMKYRAEAAEAALSAVQLDATRWRALLSSPAIRILGHAGLQDDKPIDGHYCHFGMEIWSHYEPYYDNKKAGEVITRYADNMIAASLV